MLFIYLFFPSVSPFVSTVLFLLHELFLSFVFTLSVTVLVVPALIFSPTHTKISPLCGCPSGYSHGRLSHIFSAKRVRAHTHARTHKLNQLTNTYTCEFVS